MNKRDPNSTNQGDGLRMEASSDLIILDERVRPGDTLFLSPLNIYVKGFIAGGQFNPCTP